MQTAQTKIRDEVEENLTLEELKELVEKKVYVKNDEKYIRLGNYCRDFSLEYLYFGMTKSGNVRLGDIISESYNGSPREIKNKFGIITPRIKHEMVEGQYIRVGIEHNLHTDGFRYSTILERPEP